MKILEKEHILVLDLTCQRSSRILMQDIDRTGWSIISENAGRAHRIVRECDRSALPGARTRRTNIVVGAVPTRSGKNRRNNHALRFHQYFVNAIATLWTC